MDEKKKEALKAFRQRLYGYQKAKSKDPDLTWWGYRSQKYDEDADFQYQNWKNSLPDNLQEPETVSPPYREFKEGDYNLYGAYQGGAQPRMQEDWKYHLDSRNPYTGEILKSKDHPTYQMAIDADKSAGYYPVEKNGKTYTRQYLPSNDVSGYALGTDTDGVVYAPGAQKPYTEQGRLKTDFDYKNEDIVDQPYWDMGSLPAFQVTGSYGARNPWVTVNTAGYGTPVSSRNWNYTESSTVPELSTETKTKQQIQEGHQQLEEDRVAVEKQRQEQLAKDVVKGAPLTALEGVGKLFMPSTYTGLLSDNRQMKGFGESLDLASMVAPTTTMKALSAPLLFAGKSSLFKKAPLFARTVLHKLGDFTGYNDVKAINDLREAAPFSWDYYFRKQQSLSTMNNRVGHTRPLYGNFRFHDNDGRSNMPQLFFGYGAVPVSVTVDSSAPTVSSHVLKFTDELGNVAQSPVTKKIETVTPADVSGTISPDGVDIPKTIQGYENVGQFTAKPAENSGVSIVSLTAQDNKFQTAVQNYVDRLNKRMDGDGVVSGSLVHYGNGTIPATISDTGELVGPADTEIYTTAKRLPSLQKKLELQATGGTNAVGGVRGESPYIFKGGGSGHESTEINVIGENADGYATGALAHQIYRANHPKEYSDLLRKAEKSQEYVETVQLPLPVTAEELFQEVLKNPQAMKKSAMTDMMLANKRNDAVTKAGRRTRSVLFNTPDEKRDQEALDVLIDGAIANVGKGYQPATTMFPNMRFDNVDANKQFLKEAFKLNDETADLFARSPKKMELLMEQFHQSLTTSRRGISADLWAKTPDGQPIHDVAFEMFSMPGAAGDGNIAGGGLNRASASFGGMGLRPFTSNAQYPFALNRENISNPMEYLTRARQATKEDTTLGATGLILGQGANGRLQYDYDRARNVTALATANDTPVFYGPYGGALYTGAYVSPVSGQMRYIGNSMQNLPEIGQQDGFVLQALGYPTSENSSVFYGSSQPSVGSDQLQFIKNAFITATQKIPFDKQNVRTIRDLENYYADVYAEAEKGLPAGIKADLSYADLYDLFNSYLRKRSYHAPEFYAPQELANIPNEEFTILDAYNISNKLNRKERELRETSSSSLDHDALVTEVNELRAKYKQIRISLQKDLQKYNREAKLNKANRRRIESAFSDNERKHDISMKRLAMEDNFVEQLKKSKILGATSLLTAGATAGAAAINNAISNKKQKLTQKVNGTHAKPLKKKQTQKK